MSCYTCVRCKRAGVAVLHVVRLDRGMPVRDGRYDGMSWCLGCAPLDEGEREIIEGEGVHNVPA